MDNLKEIIADIKNNLSQTSASRKDEVTVMRGMLNDTTFTVGVYGKDGLVDTYCPAEDARSMVAGILKGAAHVTNQEAIQLAGNYEFTNSDATSMVRISKEFVNVYLDTGRKLPLGCREKSDVSLAKKEVAESTKIYPVKIGVEADGSDKWGTGTKTVPAHESIKVFGSCPDWCKPTK